MIIRDFFSGDTRELTLAEGKISAIKASPGKETDFWLAPPLVDLQVNGFAGIDFQQSDLTSEELLHACRALRGAGCTQWMLTLITAEWPGLLRRLRHLAKIRNDHRELLESCLGFHIEGPFLSDQPGYCGAHRADLMLDPTPEKLQELRSILPGVPLLLTMAPERNGFAASLETAQRLGIRISLGHTDASREQLRQAISGGAMGFTHLGNGSPQAWDRHENIVWRVLDDPQFMISLIPDGIHVSPAFFRLIHRSYPSEKIYYVSDATSAAGSKPGTYRLGEMVIEVGPDEVVRQPGRSNFAGSALQPFAGLLRAHRMVLGDWRECWAKYSIQPAGFLGCNVPWNQPGAWACLLAVRHGEIQPQLTMLQWL